NMYRDFEGFVLADKNVNCGMGYSTLKDVLKHEKGISDESKLVALEFCTLQSKEECLYGIFKKEKNGNNIIYRKQLSNLTMKEIFNQFKIFVFENSIDNKEKEELEEAIKKELVREIND
ncbi:MAG: hypothetical protein JJT77_08975, partial [Crocinitomicaceae bacterium]|nr:hypothetical protein [Crocinitomicaceae bacterium]